MKKFLPYLYPVLLTIIIVFIALANYMPGTFLSGWDTLHPEFDFPLNFNRLFFGVWRDEQGLGAVAGHTHMSDLPRVIFLWIMHFAFPLSSLKYLYIFLCLLLGPLGIYFLIKYILLYIDRLVHPLHQTTGKHTPLHSSPRFTFTAQTIAFISALFYLLNLSAVQQFYVPFEMFPAQYGYLPWIMLYTIQYLNEGSRRSLFLFALVTLLATPQAYAAHLWFPFFGVYGLFLILFFLLKDRTKKTFIKTVVLVALTVLMNSFWLFPNIYYIITQSDIPRFTKQNRIFSQEYRLRNREDGYIQDVAISRGFYLDWFIEDFGKERFVALMPEWRDHLTKPFVLGIGYFFFAGALLGFILSFLRKKTFLIALSPFIVVPFAFLANRTVPFNYFFEYFLRYPLLEEALRFVFTKFSILLIFGYVLYFSFLLYFVFTYIKKRHILWVSTVVLSGMLVYYSLPVFQGHLISDKVRVKIPKEYFALWEYMNRQEDGVALSLPLHNFSGWQFYNWGYQGSGFIWFPLKQPLIDRDSDRWAIPNEQAFREFHYSVYARNTEDFATNLDKYNIRYLIWDKNNISWSIKNRRQIVYEREISSILSRLIASGKIKTLASFGKVNIYKINEQKTAVTIKDIPRHIVPAYKWTFADFAYLNHGDYTNELNNTVKNTVDIYYPFRDIIDDTDRIKKGIIEIETDDNSYYIRNQFLTEDAKLHIPDYLETEDAIPADVQIQQGKSSNSYIITFQLLLPKNLAKPITYQTALPGADVLPLDINGQTLVFDKRVLQKDKPTYFGQAFVYTKQSNYINGKKIALVFPPVNTQQSAAKLFAKFPLKKFAFDATKIFDLNKGARGVSLQKIHSKPVVDMQANNHQSGAYLEMDSLPHSLGYIMIFRSKNIEGLPVRICLKNLYSNICTLYDELSHSSEFTDDYFLIPPTGEDIGYGISLDNISFGKYNSRNQIEQITMIPFPANFLSKLYYKSGTEDKVTLKASANMSSSSKIAPFLYRMKYEKNTLSPHATLILHQSYNIDWNAYAFSTEPSILQTYLPFFFTKALPNHVVVDNWANGWRLDTATPTHIVILFWPQHLQFVGFILIPLSFMGIWFFLRRKRA